MAKKTNAPRRRRPQSIGEHIRAAREAAGISQRELDRRAGLTLGHIGALERGTRPRVDTLVRIATALGVTLEALA